MKTAGATGTGKLMAGATRTGKHTVEEYGDEDGHGGGVGQP